MTHAPSQSVAGDRARTTIVVVEDEPDVRRLLEYELTDAGYTVVALARAAKVVEIVAEEDAPLLILDRMLPDGDGLAICRDIRKDPRTRRASVLLLTARGSEKDRLDGFEVGADDYVVKPFSIRELMGRVRILLSVAGDRRKASSAQDDARIFRWRDLVMDVRSHRVFAGGIELELRPIEFLLLLTLFEGPTKTWSREELLVKVWKGAVGTGRRAVDVHVRRLREHLGTYGEAVETVYANGYRLRVE